MEKRKEKPYFIQKNQADHLQLSEDVILKNSGRRRRVKMLEYIGSLAYLAIMVAFVLHVTRQ